MPSSPDTFTHPLASPCSCVTPCSESNPFTQSRPITRALQIILGVPTLDPEAHPLLICTRDVPSVPTVLRTTFQRAADAGGLAVLALCLKLFLFAVYITAFCVTGSILTFVAGQQILGAARGGSWEISSIWAARTACVGALVLAPAAALCGNIYPEVHPIVKLFCSTGMGVIVGVTGSALLAACGVDAQLILSSGDAAIAALVGAAVTVMPLHLYVWLRDLFKKPATA